MEPLAGHWHFIETKASEMGVNSEALRKWRERGKVPYRWRWEISEAARAEGVNLPPEIFDNVPSKSDAA